MIRSCGNYTRELANYSLFMFHLQLILINPVYKYCFDKNTLFPTDYYNLSIDHMSLKYKECHVYIQTIKVPHACYILKGVY